MTTDEPLDPFVNDAGIPSYVLPYEEVPDQINPGALAALGDTIACGHCDFRTAVVQTPIGTFPVLYLSFLDSQRRPLMPIAMILDVETMQGFKEQLVTAINDGIRKAKLRGAS